MGNGSWALQISDNPFLYPIRFIHAMPGALKDGLPIVGNAASMSGKCHKESFFNVRSSPRPLPVLNCVHADEMAQGLLLSL